MLQACTTCNHDAHGPMQQLARRGRFFTFEQKCRPQRFIAFGGQCHTPPKSVERGQCGITGHAYAEHEPLRLHGLIGTLLLGLPQQTQALTGRRKLPFVAILHKQRRESTHTIAGRKGVLLHPSVQFCIALNAHRFQQHITEGRR